MSTMPSICATRGYAGYPSPPHETVWSKHVADRLATVGIDTYTNNANEKNSGMPDTVMQGTFGFVYVEFKGPDTPVRGNQEAIARRMNAKSFYSRGELCCFVYRAPDLLGILLKSGSIFQLAKCDALSSPAAFKASLTDAVDIISTGDKNAVAVATLLDLPVLPNKMFKVTHICKNEDDSFEEVIEAPTRELALKKAAGTPILSRYHLIGGTTFFKAEEICSQPKS